MIIWIDDAILDWRRIIETRIRAAHGHVTSGGRYVFTMIVFSARGNIYVHLALINATMSVSVCLSDCL